MADDKKEKPFYQMENPATIHCSGETADGVENISLINKFQSGLMKTFALVNDMDDATKRQAIASLQTLVASSSTLHNVKPPRETVTEASDIQSPNMQVQVMRDENDKRSEIQSETLLQRNISGDGKGYGNRLQELHAHSSQDATLEKEDNKEDFPVPQQIINEESESHVTGKTIHFKIRKESSPAKSIQTSNSQAMDSTILEKKKPSTHKVEPSVLAFLRRTRKATKAASNAPVQVEKDGKLISMEKFIQESETSDIDTPELICRNGHCIRLVKTVHSSTWICGTCQRDFPFKASAFSHLRCHSGEQPFTCEQCGRGFSFYANMARHMKDLHGVYPLQCEYCRGDFKTKKDLRVHLKDVHNKDLQNELQCEICGQEIGNKAEVSKHMREAHPDQARKFQCSYCDKKFYHQPNLVRHTKTHMAEKQHACNICHASFIEKRSLQVHMARYHDNDESRGDFEPPQEYPCEECGKVFMAKGNLTVHMRVHTRAQPFECTYCHKRFSVKSNLVRHERIHRGEKPYACKYCNKYFSEKRSMIIHQRLHTGEKPYKCELCDRSFAQLGTLHTHLPSHTKERKFKCDACPSTFLRRSHLTLHAKKHVGTPSLPCTQCHLKFERRSELAQHMLQHTYTITFPPENDAIRETIRQELGKSNMLHICSICGREFAQTHLLHQHLETHRDEEKIDIRNVSESQLAAEGIMSLSSVNTNSAMQSAAAEESSMDTDTGPSTIVLESDVAENIEDIQNVLENMGVDFKAGDWQVIVTPSDTNPGTQQITLQNISNPSQNDSLDAGNTSFDTVQKQQIVVQNAQGSRENQFIILDSNTNVNLKNSQQNLPVMVPIKGNKVHRTSLQCNSSRGSENLQIKAHTEDDQNEAVFIIKNPNEITASSQKVFVSRDSSHSELQLVYHSGGGPDTFVSDVLY